MLTVNDPQYLDFQGVKQVMRITREREQVNRPETATAEIIYAMTSVDAEPADPKQLLSWNRGHWGVEVNHHIRDQSLGEDACRMRANNGPGNRAQCRNIALALIAFSNPCFDSIPQILNHYSLNHGEAFQALFAAIRNTA